MRVCVCVCVCIYIHTYIYINDWRRGHQRRRWLDAINDAMNMNLSKFQEMMRDREAWHSAVYRVAKSQTRLGKQHQYMYIHIYICVYM